MANLYFIVNTPLLSTAGFDPWITVPAQILFVVSAYRCLLPVRYEGNIVFHETPLSSVFVTRLLATGSEVAYIFLFSYVLRLLNQDHLLWVVWLSWAMVVQVVVSQFFVWAAILEGRLEYYFYEEMGWALIFAANTAASIGLYLSAVPARDEAMLLQLNLLFGALYLPWQILHLRQLRANAKQGNAAGATTSVTAGVRRAIHLRVRRTDAVAWGGWIGLSWMAAYWATLIPLWVFTVSRTLHAH